MTRRFRRWRRTLSAPAFFAVDVALCAAAVPVLLPVVGWPAAAAWGAGLLPFALVDSGWEWISRRDPVR